MGLNGSEAISVFFASFVMGMSISAIVTVLTDTVGFIALAGFILTLIIGWLFAKVLRYVKRQRPQGYYQQWLMVKTSGWMGGRVRGMSIICKSGPFDYYRQDDTGGRSGAAMSIR